MQTRRSVTLPPMKGEIFMTNRETLKSYIQNGSDRFYCSVQIGGGAGYDARLAGKTWLSEATPEDTAAAYRRYDMLPLYNFGLCDLSVLTDEIRTESDPVVQTGDMRVWKRRIVTKKGTLEAHYREDEFKGVFTPKYFITEEDELDVLDYYLDALLETEDFSPVTEHVAAIRRKLGEDEPLDIQWAMQPYELLCFPDTMNTAIFAAECPERFTALMDKVLRLDRRLISAVAAGGADFVFLGGPGAEMISPDYYERFLVPYSKLVTQCAHDAGLLIYSHVCSPIEPMLSMGYYNQMGIDLFETLSEPPVGNVRSIGDAFSKLDARLCTRGNVGLDALMNETPAQVRERSLRILEAAKKAGRKHLLAASDYIFYQTKEENLIAMTEAVREFNR